MVSVSRPVAIVILSIRSGMAQATAYAASTVGARSPPGLPILRRAGVLFSARCENYASCGAVRKSSLRAEPWTTMSTVLRMTFIHSASASCASPSRSNVARSG